jgi:hypothetical protein
MAKKIFIYVAGTLILAPIVMALCCNSLLYVTFAIAYAVLVWNSPKFSTRIRKFWLEFWKINIQVTKYEI